MAIINVLNIGEVALPGDGYAPLSAFTIPEALRVGLVLAAFPGSGLIDDFGMNGAPTKIIGAPTRITAGMRCDQSNYIEATGLVDTGAVSMAFIGRRRTTAATGYAGNLRAYSSIDVRGAGFITGAAGSTVAFNAGRTGLSAGATVASVAAAVDSWGFYAGRASTSQDTIVTNLTSGASITNSSNTGTARVTHSSLIRIGALPDPNYAGGADIALTMIWSRYLTDADIALLSAWGKAYGTALGITV